MYYLCFVFRANVSDRGPNRQWSDEELLELIEKIKNGYTYQDVTEGKLVPISTLWTR